MLSLAHRRVLVTRARGQASALAALLEERGGKAVLLPTVAIVPPASWDALDAALLSLGSFDWLLFTSANAVGAFAARARTLGLMLDPPRIAVIGPATARAVVGAGLAATVDLMPARFVAEAFAEALAPHCSGARLLLVRAAAARDVLPDALRNAGAHLTIADAYQNVVPQESLAATPALLGADADPPLDAITFTSASTANHLSALLEVAGLTLPRGLVLSSIGPITSAAMRAAGFAPTVEAKESTVESLVDALGDHFSSL